MNKMGVRFRYCRIWIRGVFRLGPPAPKVAGIRRLPGSDSKNTSRIQMLLASHLDYSFSSTLDQMYMHIC